MPVTFVFGSPPLNVSTVLLRHSSPAFFLMRSMTSFAVISFFACAQAIVGTKTSMRIAAKRFIELPALSRVIWTCEQNALEQPLEFPAELATFPLPNNRDARRTVECLRAG